VTRANVTRKNPHGLTLKQQLVIKDVEKKVSRGENPRILDSFEKFYDVKNRETAKSLYAYNMGRDNFRTALVEGLTAKGILGADSKTEQRLVEGLDAEKKGEVDYEVRLKYIQEVNKIAGVYAPETKKNLNLTLDMTEEELDKHIDRLKEQLE